MPPSPDHHHVRRVVLPSGKTIEVVYFEDSSVPGHEAAAAPAPADLHVCPCCTGEMVLPVAWEEADRDHWQVTLRCPNCEWRATSVHSQEAVERFDEHLDRGTAEIVRDLKRLAHANMEAEIERFARALELDVVVPEDF